MGNIKDLTGLKFGRLAIIGIAKERRNGQAVWKCLCECGKIKLTRGSELRSEGCKSCGCLAIDLTIKRSRTHGMTGTPEYKAWESMIRRCYNPKSGNFGNYGGRGISVCDRWRKSASNFLEDMGLRPDGFSIEIKNNNGNYEPDNCIWADKFKQARNRRDNHKISVGGRTLTVMEWSLISNVRHDTILSRLRYGWDNQIAVFKPARHKSK